MWEVAVKDSLFLSSTQKEAIFFGLTGWRKNGRFPQNLPVNLRRQRVHQLDQATLQRGKAGLLRRARLTGCFPRRALFPHQGQHALDHAAVLLLHRRKTAPEKLHDANLRTDRGKLAFLAGTTTGARVIVTGATGGMGRAITAAFAQAGARVMATDLAHDGAELLAAIDQLAGK